MAFSSTSRSTARENRFPSSGNDPHNGRFDPAVAGEGIVWNVFPSEADNAAAIAAFRRRPRGYFQLLFRYLDPLVIPPFLAFLDVTLIRHLLATFLAEIRAARQQDRKRTRLNSSHVSE